MQARQALRAVDDEALVRALAGLVQLVAHRDAEGEAALKYHTPALRNALVLLFSRQEDAAVSSSGGREQIRQQALSELRDIMQTESGEPVIEDLVFSNFVVQH